MSEDDSEDRLDQNPHDPERLKAFNVSLIFFYFVFQFNFLLNFLRCLSDSLLMKT